MFAVMLLGLCSWSLLGVFCESVSVTEGDSVYLSVNLTEHQGIRWKFQAAGSDIIAQILSDGSIIVSDDQRSDGRFKNRLELHKTGSLTIKNIRSSDAGLYQVTETSNAKQLHIFNITVFARLPVPVISRVSSSSNCSVLCSVMNVSHVSLSWYKGKSLLSNISVSEHSNINISLHLECLDDSYTCVVNNSITNQTQHLNTDVCHKCSSDLSSESFCCCGFSEAVIRLVASTLVGVATVAVLVYDIRARRDEQKKKRLDIHINDQ